MTKKFIERRVQSTRIGLICLEKLSWKWHFFQKTDALVKTFLNKPCRATQYILSISIRGHYQWCYRPTNGHTLLLRYEDASKNGYWKRGAIGLKWHDWPRNTIVKWIFFWKWPKSGALGSKSGALWLRLGSGAKSGALGQDQELWGQVWGLFGQDRGLGPR